MRETRLPSPYTDEETGAPIEDTQGLCLESVRAQMKPDPIFFAALWSPYCRCGCFVICYSTRFIYSFALGNTYLTTHLLKYEMPEWQTHSRQQEHMLFLKNKSFISFLVSGESVPAPIIFGILNVPL